MKHIVHSPFVSSPTANLPFHFVKEPKEHLSTWDAHQILKTKKIVLHETRNFSFNSIWKTVNVSLLLNGLMAGYYSFAKISNEMATMSHQLDISRQYQYVPTSDRFDNDWIKEENVHYGLAKDGLWTDHTRDLWIPNNLEGAKLFLPIALIPALLPVLAWKTVNVASKAYTFCKNYTPNQQNREIEALDILLLATSKKEKNTPCPSSLISEFLKYELLVDEQFQQLSFSQIRNLKENVPDRFNALLNEHKFSKSQNVYWDKLKLMLVANPDNVSKAILNGENSQIFEDEPEMLEVFIQNIESHHLTDSVKQALVIKLRMIHKPLLMLEKEAVLMIIEAVHQNKWTVEKAYQKQCHWFEDNNEKNQEILFHFTDANQNSISISVSGHLLSQASDTFKAMIYGSYQESKTNEIHLPDVDPKSFEELISYLKTGSLDLEKIDVVNLLHLAKTYFFTDLHLLIEKELVNTIIYFYEEHNISELLDLCDTYNLSMCQTAIDLKISRKLPSFFSDDFLELLKLINEFTLPITHKKITKAIIKDLENLTQDERFSDHFVEAIMIHTSLLNELNLALTNSININPKLLGKLWDVATAKNAGFFLDIIVEYCQQPNTSHIVLANWDLPPTRPLSKIVAIQIEEI